MLPINIALITKSRGVPFDDLSVVAGALQKQLTRDFAPLWGIKGTVAAYPLGRAPSDYWQITVVDELSEPGMEGYHDDANGQPYALVVATKNDDWTVTASHEMLEMAVDPFGSRFVAGWANERRVNYLVEACDPCEADECVYGVNGIRVSDFVTPAYFEPVAIKGARYSFSGKIDGPKQLRPGGYVSWMETDTADWWQKDFFGSQPAMSKLGRLELVGRNARSTIDALTRARKRELRA